MTEPENIEALDMLMREYQGGSLAAFEALYRALAPRVNTFLRAKVKNSQTNDLLQETFLEIHRSRHTYLPGSSVASWAYGVAHNVVLRHRNIQRKHHQCEVSTELSELESHGSHDTFELQPLHDALNQLSSDARTTWWMRNIEGLSFDAIATKLGIAVAAARLRCSRASKTIRAALERGPENE